MAIFGPLQLESQASVPSTQSPLTGCSRCLKRMIPLGLQGLGPLSALHNPQVLSEGILVGADSQGECDPESTPPLLCLGSSLTWHLPKTAAL